MVTLLQKFLQKATIKLVTNENEREALVANFIKVGCRTNANLIGYDGSEYSDAIFDNLKLAGLPGDAEIKVVTIADLLMSSPSAGEVAAQIIPS